MSFIFREANGLSGQAFNMGAQCQIFSFYGICATGVKAVQLFGNQFRVYVQPIGMYSFW